MEYPMTLHVEYDGCPSSNFDHTFTGGAYALSLNLNPLLCNDSIRIHLTGEANAKDGVSTLDLVKLVKHMLGTELLTNLFHYIAADANNSESVSALDIIEIKKLILGHYTEWPKNKTLRFFVRTTQEPPPLSGPYPKVEFVLAPQAANMTIDFWGVKTGELSQF
jgi:hypothetical protein